MAKVRFLQKSGLRGNNTVKKSFLFLQSGCGHRSWALGTRAMWNCESRPEPRETLKRVLGGLPVVRTDPVIWCQSRGLEFIRNFLV